MHSSMPRFLFLVFLVFAHSTAGEEVAAVKRFRDYLRIPTVHPLPDYRPPSNFILRQGEEIGLIPTHLELSPGKDLVVLTWPGRDPSLPSIQLNSHMDVVPAEADKWHYDPFKAEKDEDGNIFARGSQDMKSVGMQYLEAIRKLLGEGFQPLRTVHVTFVPEEEIGGRLGLKQFVDSDFYSNMNVGLHLDEGLASPTAEYRVFYGERAPWWLVVCASGQPGHGSKNFDNSAIETLTKSMTAIAEFRASQFELVKAGQAADGEVISINPVFLDAGSPTPTGYVMNLQPSEASAGYDIRLPPTADVAALERLIAEEWAPSSRNMSYHFVQKTLPINMKGAPSLTPLGSDNPWWNLFIAAVERAGKALARPEIFPAATDARFVRFKDVPAIGFSPMSNTPVLLHDHNEFLNEVEYLKGIDVYSEIIRALSSYRGHMTPLHSEL